MRTKKAGIPRPEAKLCRPVGRLEVASKPSANPTDCSCCRFPSDCPLARRKSPPREWRQSAQKNRPKAKPQLQLLGQARSTTLASKHPASRSLHDSAGSGIAFANGGMVRYRCARMIGTTFDSFNVLEKINRGGMADIYLVTDRSGQRLMLRVLLPEYRF